MKDYDVIIIGGGAAGFFTAINIAEMSPSITIAILERGHEGLQKVKISGGGRCNVTHAEFTPSELVLNYPRGEKELLGPFHQFMTGDTIDWFLKRDIQLKIEEDGRMFPTSDSSKTIVDCFLNEAKKHHIDIFYNQSVKSFIRELSGWKIETIKSVFQSQTLVLTTGSNSKIWALLKRFGHTIIDAVPSLFTFKIEDERISNIPGVVVNHVTIKVKNSDLMSTGPLLITHVGMSAPAILKLSSFGAIEFAKRDYKFKVEINFVSLTKEECLDALKACKHRLNKKTISKFSQFQLPKRLWQELVKASDIFEATTWADVKRQQLESLSLQLTTAIFSVEGKSTFKEEFVTAGGVDLKEINFKSFESKLYPTLYFAGEILNIDAVTGGFNFQNAWTGGYIAAKSISMNHAY